MRHEIEMHEPSDEFVRCWQAAGRHIQNLSQGPDLSWLKADLKPPFLEHLSFRIGNQLFFVRIEDTEDQLPTPGNPTGLASIASGCQGHACLMPMKQSSDEWLPNYPGWGLIDASSRKPINPVSLVTNENIEMTDWELHDFAVQVVRDHVEKTLGFELMSSQGNPQVDPSIWFVGKQGPEWVVVRAVRYPEKEAALPSNLQEIEDGCVHLSRIGHFASVSLANSEDAFDSAGGLPSLPLWRGHGMFVSFQGLVQLDVPNNLIPHPHSVPLNDIEAALNATTLQTSREGNTLVIQHEKLVSKLSVLSPTSSDSENGPISAIVQIKTMLPKEVSSYFSKREFLSTVNSMAASGAVTSDDDGFFIGSRLTVYENDNAWAVQLPLLLFSVTGGVDSILGASRRALSKEEPIGGSSLWTEGDLALVESYLSKMSFCNAGEKGLTAEFGLKADAISAIAGDQNTALWQLFTDQPHPELGGGLFCLLQLPHQIHDIAKLDQIIDLFNQLEMEPNDLPPHFGAWCRGAMGNNPAYVSFLPNALHDTQGIALNMSIWAFHRTQWADAVLATHGIRA